VFAEYAAVLGRRLGDREGLITLNEPLASTIAGCSSGSSAG
jgi:hypothetical protein